MPDLPTASESGVPGFEEESMAVVRLATDHPSCIYTTNIGTAMKLFIYSVIAAAILCGLFLPQFGNYSSYILPMILLMLFLNFLDLKIEPHRLLRKELLITFFLSIVIMPSITYYILSIGFEPSYRMGLLLVACSPSGVMGIILIHYITYRDYNLVFSNLLFSTFGSILFIPIILKLILGQTFLIEFRPIIVQTAALVIIPFLATRLVNRFFPDKQLQLINKIPKFVVPFLMFLIISTSIGSAASQLKWDLTLLRLSVSVLGIYLLHAGLGYFAGSLIGKKELRNTLTFISSSRNCQIVLALAILNFSPLTTVPIIIAIIFHHITNAFWLWMLQK